MATKETKSKEVTEGKAVEQPKPKYAKIKLFRDNGRYKDAKFVGWNGQPYYIQRGVEVEVPIQVAEILEQSEAQEMALAQVIYEAESEYSGSEDKLN